MFRTARLVVIAIALLLVGVAGGSAASPTPSPTKQDVAKKILGSEAGKTMSAPARAYMESVARGDHRLAPDSSEASSQQGAAQVTAARATGGSALTNVRVNNPALDTHATDQTTQSATSITGPGRHTRSTRQPRVRPASRCLAGTSRSASTAPSTRCSF